MHGRCFDFILIDTWRCGQHRLPDRFCGYLPVRSQNLNLFRRLNHSHGVDKRDNILELESRVSFLELHNPVIVEGNLVVIVNSVFSCDKNQSLPAGIIDNIPRRKPKIKSKPKPSCIPGDELVEVA